MNETEQDLRLEIARLRARVAELELREKALRQDCGAASRGEAPLELLAAHMDDVFWITDWQTHATVYASPSFERLWGRSRASLYANPQEWADAIHPEDRERAWDSFVQMGEGTTYDEVYRIVRPDGGEVWIHDHAVPVRDEHGRVTHAVGMARDITETRRSQELALQAQKMQAIGRLAGGVAHDFNNMLSGILGFAALLQHDLGADDPRRGDLCEIVAICQRARELTGNLLGFARKGRFRRERVDLNGAIHNVERLLAHTVPRKVSISLELATGLPAVEGDPAQLEQVVMNLALNAADAVAGGGSMVIRTGRIPGARGEPGQVELVVGDSGAGMAPEVQRRAFEPFFTTKAPGEGTGLGLAMVYGTVSNHGGSVRLDSVPGAGTTVTVLLPAVSAVAAGERADTTVEPALPRGTGTVLVVDDEPVLRRAMSRLLGRLGYAVVLAEDGVEAVEQVGAQDLDLVLLDLAMPVMDGPEAYEAIRELRPDLPVLLCSGYGPDSVADQLIDRGAAGFLQKPIAYEDLARVVAGVLGS